MRRLLGGALIGGVLYFWLFIPSVNGFYRVEMVGWWVDSVSWLLVVLVFFIISLRVFLCQGENLVYHGKILFTLLIFLVIRFLLDSFLGFFIFFELSVIPILFLILGWGAQPERIVAGSYLFLYTFLGSLPLLIKILYLRRVVGRLSFRFYELSFIHISGGVFRLFWVLAFLIKLPMYGVHLWLPKAHVEASTIGSMILAGVLLKLGGYGLYRLGYFCWKVERWGVCGWVIVSLVVTSYICFRQHDMKSMVAYSSITHMGVVILGFGGGLGIRGGVLIMISHGIIRRGLFLGVGEWYKNISRRSVLLCGGGVLISPLFIFLWILLLRGKMSIPPSFKFLRELITIIWLGRFGLLLWGRICVMIFLVGLYRIYLYIIVRHGKKKNFVNVKVRLLRNYLLFVHLIFSYIWIFFLKNWV